MGSATSSAAPERARWPRLAAWPHRQLRPLLPRGYAGFAEATVPRHLVLPATALVPLVVKMLDSPRRPPAFIMGARGSPAVAVGDCAPSSLEVWLAPLGAPRREPRSALPGMPAADHGPALMPAAGHGRGARPPVRAPAGNRHAPGRAIAAPDGADHAQSS